LAVGEPPHSNVHPMRAIFLIPTSEPPTLPDPTEWSTDFNAFLKVCLQKEPSKRPTATQLLQHTFITKAKGKAVIAALVDECMQEIDEYREQEAKEAEEKEKAEGTAGASLHGKRDAGGTRSKHRAAADEATAPGGATVPLDKSDGSGGDDPDNGTMLFNTKHGSEPDFGGGTMVFTKKDNPGGDSKNQQKQYTPLVKAAQESKGKHAMGVPLSAALSLATDKKKAAAAAARAEKNAKEEKKEKATGAPAKEPDVPGEDEPFSKTGTMVAAKRPASKAADSKTPSAGAGAANAATAGATGAATPTSGSVTSGPSAAKVTAPTTPTNAKDAKKNEASDFAQYYKTGKSLEVSDRSSLIELRKALIALNKAQEKELTALHAFYSEKRSALLSLIERQERAEKKAK